MTNPTHQISRFFVCIATTTTRRLPSVALLPILCAPDRVGAFEGLLLSSKSRIIEIPKRNWRQNGHQPGQPRRRWFRQFKCAGTRAHPVGPALPCQRSRTHDGPGDRARGQECPGLYSKGCTGELIQTVNGETGQPIWKCHMSVETYGRYDSGVASTAAAERFDRKAASWADSGFHFGFLTHGPHI